LLKIYNNIYYCRDETSTRLPIKKQMGYHSLNKDKSKNANLPTDNIIVHYIASYVKSKK